MWNLQVVMVALVAVVTVTKATIFDTSRKAPLSINAFNIQIFGQAKMSDPVVVAHLVNIINRYDVVLIQEIRDADEVAIYELLDECNAATEEHFSMVMSGRLGRTSSTEQYAFFFRAIKFQVLDTYQWDEDYRDDDFERPPYVVHFRSSVPDDIREFGFIPIHAKPDDAVAEIDALVNVYDGMVEMWGIEDFIIGGDFNAACDYVGEEDWVNIRLRTDERFQWLIGDNVNTRTRTDYTCAYDRLVLAGSNLQGAYEPESGTTFRFDDFYDLTEEEALDVSDHVPVVMVMS